MNTGDETDPGMPRRDLVRYIKEEIMAAIDDHLLALYEDGNFDMDCRIEYNKQRKRIAQFLGML